MRTLIGAAMVAAVALIAGCSTTQYVIGTRSGQLIVAYGEPRLDRSTNMYTYRDADGKDMSIAASEVTQIIER